MERCTRRAAQWVTLPLTLGMLATAADACSSGNNQPPSPSSEELTRVSDLAWKAAEDVGAHPQMATAAAGAQGTSVGIESLTAGATYGAFAACTGGDSITLDLAGTAVVLDCDDQGHHVSDLVVPSSSATFTVTQPGSLASEWGIALSQN